MTHTDAPASDAVRGERATARGRVTMLPDTARAIAAHEIAKGDVLAVARFAGVQAAKDAASYVPLIVSDAVRDVVVNFTVGERFIDVTVSVTCLSEESARLRALSAVTVASLTVYDMCKSADRTMRIGPVALFSPPAVDPPNRTL